MSHWRGGMGELHDTMQAWSDGMGHLAQVSQNVAIAAGGRIRGRGLAAMGDTTSGTWDSSGPVSSGLDNIVSVNKQATGNTVYTYADGSIKIFNSAGVDVTSNYITTPAGTSSLQNAALAANEAVSPAETTISNAISTAASTASNVVSSIASGAQSILMVAAIAGVIYFAYKMDGKK